jgi:predicted RNA binding protein YcfA (HicA-like mRNA interferase family)
VKFRRFIEILRDHDFKPDRSKGSHHQYEGYVDGKRYIVTLAFSHDGEEISKRNLSSMIRQSGLPKKLFR